MTRDDSTIPWRQVQSDQQQLLKQFRKSGFKDKRYLEAAMALGPVYIPQLLGKPANRPAEPDQQRLLSMARIRGRDCSITVERAAKMVAQDMPLNDNQKKALVERLRKKYRKQRSSLELYAQFFSFMAGIERAGRTFLSIDHWLRVNVPIIQSWGKAAVDFSQTWAPVLRALDTHLKVADRETGDSGSCEGDQLPRTVKSGLPAPSLQEILPARANSRG